MLKLSFNNHLLTLSSVLFVTGIRAAEWKRRLNNVADLLEAKNVALKGCYSLATRLPKAVSLGQTQREEERG